MEKKDNRELFDEDGRSRGFYSRKNVLNELTGKEWLYWSKSVITKPYPLNLQHKLRSQHGAQKPPDLCADLIRIFTKKEGWVLDPLAGVGGTLIGAARCGRKALGIEIDPRWIEIYRKVCRLEGIAEQRMIQADCRKELPKLSDEGFQADFILTDVPFWRMDKVAKSKGKYKTVGSPSRENRKSKLSSFNPIIYESKQDWLDQMTGIFRHCIPLLKDRRYLAVFIGDMYFQREYHFLSADLANTLRELGLTMKANIIWYDGSKSLHIYGYRYEYIPSFLHQNILVFRKEPRRRE
jgi:DNA modification methylase